jgi:tetratricopeptide (TPR) repeat protein
LILLLFTGILARHLSGSWVVATFSILALVLMPRLSGQAFGNLKDIPFAAGYMAGLLMTSRFLRELPHPRWQTTILLGLAIAFTVSVRAGGFILFAYLGLSLMIFLVLKPKFLKQIVSTRPLLLRLSGQVTAIVLIGYFGGLLFWPFALQNVFLHPLESLGMMEHYSISIRQLFQGEVIWSTRLPWYYLPKWLLISTPLFVLTGFILFLFFFIIEIIRKKFFSGQLLFEGFIFFAVAFPVFYVMAIGSNLYSGVRQMLFILPPVALLATLGIYKLLRLIGAKQKKIIYPFSFLFAVLLFRPLFHQVNTFPVDYVFFNELAGGNKKAWGNYEYDYYFHGMREGAEYLIDLAGMEKVTVAMNCNLSNYFDRLPNITYQYVRFMERSSVDWDYGLFGVNYIHPYLLKNNLWQPAGTIKSFYHRGNPVAVLVKRRDKSDFKGISEINKLNLDNGVTLLELALDNDPNNVWLHVNLARAKLAAGDNEGFEHIVQLGKQIHPFYEPFFLLEATRLFDKGEYRESLHKLKELFDINPRYQPAGQLYKMVHEKLN